MTILCKLFGHRWGPPQDVAFVSAGKGGTLLETHTECLRCREKRLSSRIEPLPGDHVVSE